MTSPPARTFLSRIVPTIGISIGLFAFTAWMFTFFFLLTGSMYVRSILLVLLIYQYFFARKSELYRKFLRLLRPFDYFDKAELIIEDGDIQPTKSLICHHPHGILGYGFSLSVALNDNLYKTFHCGSRGMLNLPISGIFAKWLGLVGVDKKNFKEVMRKGKNIRFMPGGFEEATLTNPEKDRVYIKERKGFIKYALQCGYRIYPSYTFNENKVYNTINAFEGFRLWLNKFKFPGTIFYGKYGWLPRSDLEIVTVIGKALDFPVIENPSKEEVNKYHQIYVDKLKELYERHKVKYGASNELEIL